MDERQGTTPTGAGGTRRAWVVGGALLVASPLIGLTISPLVPYIVGVGYLGNVLFSASLIVFALGIRGAGSVTARRPLGTAAMVALAAWTLLWPPISDALLYSDAAPYYSSTGDGPQGPLLFLNLLIQALLALIAVTQIARSGTVPPPWTWAPTWGLAAVTLSFLMQQVMVLSRTEDVAVITTVVTLDSLIRAGTMVSLGVLAIVLANRPTQPRTVSVFRSTEGTD